MVVNNNNNNNKNNSGYDSFCPNKNNIVSSVSLMELASNSTMAIITSEETNSVTPNLRNSPVTPDATLTGSNKKIIIGSLSGSNKNIIIERLSSCNCCSALLNINSSKNDIFKVEAQLSAFTSYVNCELLILRNQIEFLTAQTKISLDHENRNIDALQKNIAFLQVKLTKKNKVTEAATQRCS